MSKHSADEIVVFIYNFLAKHMTPQALETLINKGFYARGSRSVHGFMGMMSDHHEEIKRRTRVNKDSCGPQK